MVEDTSAIAHSSVKIFTGADDDEQISLSELEHNVLCLEKAIAELSYQVEDSSLEQMRERIIKIIESMGISLSTIMKHNDLLYEEINALQHHA